MWVLDQVSKEKNTDATQKEYLSSFFNWDTCPHVRRLVKERKSIGKTHVRKCRHWLEKHVLSDVIVNSKLSEITRDVVNVIRYEDLEDIVLVGHSY